MPGLQQLWSTTPGNNQTADPSVNWREGQAPSTVNDAARQVMARVAAYVKDISGVLVTGGTSAAYTLTTNEVFTALVDGMVVGFNVHVTNAEGPITLNVDGLGAKPLRLAPGSDVVPASCFRLGAPYTAQYSIGNGGEWRARSMLDALIAPAGTRMVFQQTAAPSGWVKEAAAGFNNRALRLTTGIVGSGGTSDFTAVFASRTIAQANLPNVAFAGVTDAQGNHSHGGGTGAAGAHSHTPETGFSSFAGGNSAEGGNVVGSATANFPAFANTSTAPDHAHAIGFDGNHLHNVSVNSGGSGTALDFAVAFHDVIVAQKA